MLWYSNIKKDALLFFTTNFFASEAKIWRGKTVRLRKLYQTGSPLHTNSYWSNLNAKELSIFSLSKSMQHTGDVWQVIGWVPRITEQWMLVRGQCDWLVVYT